MSSIRKRAPAGSLGIGCPMLETTALGRVLKGSPIGVWTFYRGTVETIPIKTGPKANSSGRFGNRLKVKTLPPQGLARMDDLEALARRWGVERGYHDIFGNWRLAPEDTV